MKKNIEIRYCQTACWCFLGLAIIFLSGCGFKKAPAIKTDGKLTAAVVAEHKLSDDCWMIINNNIYNLTDYLPSRLETKTDLNKYCGQDATAIFLDPNDGIIKSDKDREELESNYLGSLKR